MRRASAFIAVHGTNLCIRPFNILNQARLCPHQSAVSFTCPFLPAREISPRLEFARGIVDFRCRFRAATPQASAQDSLLSNNNTSSKSRQRTSSVGFLVLAVIYLWSFLLIVPMLVAHPFVLAFDRCRRRFQISIALLWMRCSLACCGMWPQIIHRHLLPDPAKAVVYVANHSSYLDIFPLAFLGRRLRYVSKVEIFSLPVVGWAMYMMGNIGVRRKDRKGHADAYRNMVHSLKNGVSVVVYPEGTRSETGKMRKFQPGAFRAAKSAGVPIVPITITGTRDIMPSWAFVPLRCPRMPIRLVVHPPIASDIVDVDELRDIAFAYIDSALDPELRSLPPSRPTA